MKKHWCIGIGTVVLAGALAGCDSGQKEATAPGAAPVSTPEVAPALPSPADEARAKKEADERRKQFYGDGAHYTPQDVRGF